MTALWLAMALAPAGGPVVGARHPAVSPDGTQIAFAWRGDIWIAPVEGGAARRITTDPADEAHPAWSPDGQALAFSTDRRGNRDIATVRLSDGTITAITFHSADDDRPAWSPDGRFIAFESNRDKNLDLPVDSDFRDVWVAPAEGGTAWRVTLFGGCDPSWAPDGRAIVYTRYAGGYADGQHDLFVIRVEDGRPVAGEIPCRLVAGPEDSRSPVWHGDFVWFVHEAHGIRYRPFYNVWRVRAAGGAPVQATALTGDVRSVSVALRADFVVFEYDFALWRLTPDGPARIGITVDEAPDPALHDRTRVVRSGARDPAWSPDSSRLAIEYDGSIWVMNADGSDPQRVTHPERESHSPAWAGDGESLYFLTGPMGGPFSIARASVADGLGIEIVADREGQFTDLAVAPDGSRFAVEEHLPDGPRVRVFDTDGSSAAFDGKAPAFGPDGSLYYVEGERRLRSEHGVLFEYGGRILGFAVSPDGERFACAVVPEGATNSRLVIWERSAGRQRVLESRPDVSRLDPAWAPDGATLAYVEVAARDVGAARQDPRAAIWYRDVDDPPAAMRLSYRLVSRMTMAEENLLVFRRAWSWLDRAYYDPFHHGVDWDEVLRRYEPVLANSATAAERHDRLNEMIRELRTSHVRVSPPRRSTVETGYLGIQAEVETDGAVRVAGVVARGPAEEAGIRTGDVIVALDGRPFRDLDEALTRNVEGRERGFVPVALTVETAEGTREVQVTPISQSQLREIKYRNVIEWRERHVRERSGGRLGYHHVRYMAEDELRRLRDAVRSGFGGADGLVLDIRDGVGGMAHMPMLHLLDETVPERINRRPACYTRTRTGRVAPDRYQPNRRLVDVHWNRPVILIQNSVSRSDKEIFSHTFRHLGLGYVVGTETAGGVIGGNDLRLPDGAFMTVSIQGWFSSDGRNMEATGAEPDFHVEYTHEDLYAGRDPQLDRAVEILLAQMDGRIAAPERR
jgi:C-terminal processing protease CtpA/Prc/Tol biopolymer transport system component